MRTRHLRRLVLASSLLLAAINQPVAHAQATGTIDAHLAAAQQAQHNQNYPLAEQEYHEALNLAPRFAEIHMNLGLIYQLQGKTTEAMAEFTQSLKLKPELAGANLMLGIDLCKLGDGKRATPLLAAAVRQSPERLEAYSWLATAQELNGDYQAELLTLKRALLLQPNNPDLLYLEGHAYERLGSEAVLAMNAAAPDSTLSERLLGESYALSTEWPAALLHFENAISSSPRGPGLHVELGEVLLHAGKLDRALHAFSDELLLNSHNVRALVRRGEAELLESHLDLALNDWSQALETDPPYAEHVLGIERGSTGVSDAEPRSAELLSAESSERLDSFLPQLRALNTPASHFALAYIALHHPQAAPADDATISPLARMPQANIRCSTAVVRQAINAGQLSIARGCGPRTLNAGAPDELRMQIAASLLELGDDEAALEALTPLRHPANQSPEAAFRRARCYENLSTRAYLQLYRVNPDSFRSHQLMADLAEARGDDKKAAEEYRAAIARRSSAPNLHYSLGHVLWKNSDIPAARAEFNAELALTPRHVGALHDLAETYLMERSPQQALSYLNQAVAAGGKGPDLDRDLGTAYAQLGDFRNAEIKYNLALSSDHDGSLHFKLAKIYQALGEKDKASTEFTVAADLSRKYHAKLEEAPHRHAFEE